MLEGLKDVQWAELSHAYGSASDVPAILQALAADDEEKRNGAIHTLFSNIYHQGSVYEASAYAVPFLLELLAHDSIQDKGKILSLLAHMVGVDGYIHQHLPLSEPEPSLDYSEADPHPQFQEEMNLWLSSEKLYGPDYLPVMEGELSWVYKTYKAIVEGAELYFSLLEHSDIKVKMYAALLLANLSGLSAHVLPLFYTLFEKEENECVKANLISILGGWDKHSKRGYHLLKRLALEDSAPILRFVASLAIVRSRREDISHEAIDFLIQVVMSDIDVDEQYSQIPAEDWKASYASILALQRLESSRATYAIHQLISALHVCIRRFEEKSGYNLQQYRSNKDFWLAWDADKGAEIHPAIKDNMDNLWVATLDNLRWVHPPMRAEVRKISETLVALAFGKKKFKRGIRFHDLSQEQQIVLKTLLDCHLAWNNMSVNLARTTGQQKIQIVCVAKLECIGLFQFYTNVDYQERLRAFIEQGKGFSEW